MKLGAARAGRRPNELLQAVRAVSAGAAAGQEAALDALVEQARRLFDAPDATVNLRDPSSGVFVRRRGSRLVPPDHPLAAVGVPARLTPLTDEVVRTRRPVLVPDMLNDRRVPAWSRASIPRVVSMLVAPLVDGDQGVVGTLIVRWTGRRGLGAQDAAAAEALGVHAALAVRAAQAIDTARGEAGLLGSALDAAADAVSLWTADGRLLSANERSRRSMREMVGRVPERIDELRAVLNAADPVRAEKREAAWRLAVGGAATESLAVLPLPAGPRLVHVRNTPVRSASGAVSSVLVVSRDVTDLVDELRRLDPRLNRRPANGHAPRILEARGQYDDGPRPARPWVVVVEGEQAKPTLEAALAELGYGVIPAGTAAEALRTLETVEPNLILLDAELSGVDGAAFRREQLRRRLATRVPVVVATGRRGGLGPEWADLAVAAAVSRPFDLPELAAAVRWALEPGA